MQNKDEIGKEKGRRLELSIWEWLRRSGHREEMELWDSHVWEYRSIRLNTVGGYDVSEGLQQSVYSGG